VLEEGDAAQASRLLAEVQRKDLPEEEVAAFDGFRAEVQRIVERRTMWASLNQLRREGDAVRALSVCEELAARVQGEEAARVAEVRAEARAEVRRQFSTRIEEFDGEERPAAALHDARVFPRWKWETMLVRTRDERDEVVLIVPQTRDAWVFIRVIEVATGALLTRVTLRAPSPIVVVTAALRGRHLILVGNRGSLLEIDTDDWTVLRWSLDVLNHGDVIHPMIKSDVMPEMNMPEVIVENVTITPDNRYLWLNTTYAGRKSSTRRILSVLDLEDMRLLRELREHRATRVRCAPILGSKEPRVVVTESDDVTAQGRTTFYSSRGAPSGDPALPSDALMPHAVVACPDGERILGVTSDPDGPKDPYTVRWGFFEIDTRGVSPFRLFEGVTGVYEVTAIGSLDAGMCFVLFDLGQGGPLLFGLRAGEEGLLVTYRVRLPHRSLLVGTADGRRAALVVVHDDREEIVPLGAEPPKEAEVESPPTFKLPSLPQVSMHTPYFDCDAPTGKHLAAAIAEERMLRREGKQGINRRWEGVRRKAGPDEILAFEHGLRRIREPALAGRVASLGRDRFPDHPRVRMSYARTLASLNRWTEVRALLDGIDPSQLGEPGDVKHLHHMRGILLMMTDEPEAALIELERAAACKEGKCPPEELIPLCAPLSDVQRSWSPAQAVTRDYLRIVAGADEALARGDAAAAQRILDVPLLWEANELQSMARLAEAYLREEEGAPCDRFRKALALLSFCELFDARNTMNRREMPLPRATWEAERLRLLAVRARMWVEEALSLPTCNHQGNQIFPEFSPP